MSFPSRVGRYEIKSRIGGGGMGLLFLARDTNPTTDRLVALKLLRANLDQGDLRARFAREARSLAALSHPNIIVIHDSGEFNGAPYMVMEYVRGESLAEKIRRKARLSLGQRLRLMAELCEGLAHAHGAGIVHRDIKPANLMVDLHGRLKILDFGIAREAEGLHTAVAAPLTRAHTTMGTPGYMSPEQIEGVEVDHRTDVFSAGTVFYELISYRMAFSGATTRQIEKRVLHDEPPPLAELVPGVDPELDDVVRRALAKDAADRPQGAAQLLDAINRVVARLGSEGQATRAAAVAVDQGGGHDSRRKRAADIAFQRAVVADDEGAKEFALRSALEALAEDTDHAGARALAQRLDPSGASMPPPVDQTVLAAPAAPAAPDDAATLLAHSPERAPVRRPAASAAAGWPRAVVPALGMLAGTAVALALVAALRNGADNEPSPTATPPRGPEGGTPTSGPGESSVPTVLIATLVDLHDVSVNDAAVLLTPGEQSVPSNGRGEYLFGNVPPGDYTLRVTHPGFKDRSVNVAVVPGGVRQKIVLDRLTAPAPLVSQTPGTRKERELTRGQAPSAAPVPGPTHAVASPNEPTLTTTPTTPATIGAQVPAIRTGSTVLAQDSLERALEALNRDGDVDRAERLLAEAQRLDPESKEIAREVERLRDIRSAERRQQVRESLRQAQRLYRESGDLDGALRRLEPGLKIAPSDPELLDLRDEILRVKSVGSKKPPGDRDERDDPAWGFTERSSTQVSS